VIRRLVGAPSRSAFGWIPGRTSGERVAASIVLIAITLTAAVGLAVVAHQRDADEYRAAPPCSANATDGCVSSRPGIVTAAPRQFRFGIESDGRASRHTARPADDQDLDLLRVGAPILVREWHGEVVEVTAGDSAIRIDEHPAEDVRRAEVWLTAVALTIPMTVLIAFCVRHAAANARAPRDPAVRAGSYTMPYDARLRGARKAFALVISVGAAVTAIAFWIFGRDAALLMLVVSLLGVAFLYTLSRYRLTLNADSLSYRRSAFARERVILYQDIHSVEPWYTAAGTAYGAVPIASIRLRFAGEHKPIDLWVGPLSERNRAIVVDGLRRQAPKAKFSEDLHTLWTGAF
jgi:hypothetical protein